MTSPEEQHELHKLLLDKANVRELSFSMFREFLRSDEAALKTMGHKTQEGACIFQIKHALQEIDKLEKAFIKRWPD